MIKAIIRLGGKRLMIAASFLLLFSISAAAQKVTLNVQNKPLKEVLAAITRQTDYNFVYSDALQEINFPVTFKCDGMDLKTVLQNILSGQKIAYKIVNKNVALSPEKIVPQTQQRGTDSFLLKGKITDENGEALPGVTILNVNTKEGAWSDENGNYQIKVDVGDVLNISTIGMTTQEMQIASKSTILNIKMKTDVISLDNVVVTGYQTISKERSTGAFAKVDPQKLELKRNNNLSSILEGEVAGYVNGQIRGISTMNAISNPLVVIDGFPVENTTMDRTGETTESMPDLNPNDIESITILKDAAAASIYGARAANGVIVITTKKAMKGKTDISFSTTYTVQPYYHYNNNMTNSSDIVSLEKYWGSKNTALQAGGASAIKEAADIRENSGSYPNTGVDLLLDMYTGKITQSEAETKLNQLASNGYRYYDQAEKYSKRNSVYQQYNLRVSKTTDNNSTSFSTTYWDNKYEDIHHNDWKLGMNLSNSMNITKWLHSDMSVYLKYGKEKTQTYDLYSPNFNALPYNSLVNDDGSYVEAPSKNNKERNDLITKYGLIDETIVPMDELGYNLGKSKSFETRANAKIRVDFTKWLNYNVMFQYERTIDKYELMSDVNSYNLRCLINNFTTQSYGRLVYNLPNGNSMFKQNQEKEAYDFRQQLNFNKTFGKHNIVVIAGQEMRHSKYYYDNRTYYGYDPELLTWPTINEQSLSYVSGLLGAAILSNNPTNKELLNRFVSFYSNASYTFNDKYVLSGSIRWDKSNLWGTTAKYQNRPLWSVGGSWNISKEKFFNISFIDMLKLRASYGIGGNIGRNTAPYLVAGYYSAYDVIGLAGYVKSPPNKDIRWEKTTTINVGLDFAMFGNRLNGTLEYYNKKSDDLLAMINGSPTMGFGTSVLTTNNGAMKNNGFELTLNGNVINHKNFGWNSTVLYSYNKNEVTKISMEPFNYSTRFTMPSSFPMQGHSLYGLYAYKWAGLSEKGDPQVYDAEGNVSTGPVQDTKAVYYAGTTVPVHNLTFTNVLHYKNIEFSAMIVMQAGHKLRDINIPDINMANGKITSTSNDIMDRWQKAGDENYTDIPRLLFTNDAEYNTHRAEIYSYSDKFIYNASNVRIRNISIAYRFPEKWCRKLTLSNARIQFNVENVATFAFDHKALYSLGGKIKPNYVGGLYLNF